MEHETDSLEHPEDSLFNNSTAGNALVMGIVTIVILSMFGLTLVSRMILDSNMSVFRLLGTKSFYLADAGVQMGRRYLWLGNSSDQTFGPIALGDGSFTVEIDATRQYIGGSAFWDRENVYKITSVGTIGITEKQIDELRWRGGGSDKNFLLYREDVADEF